MAFDQFCKKLLEPEYVANKGVGNKPPNEPMVKIKPLSLGSEVTVFFKVGNTACVMAKVPVQLISMIDLAWHVTNQRY